MASSPRHETATTRARWRSADRATATLALVALLVAAADFVSKEVAVARLGAGHDVTFGPALRLALIYNDRLAWGLSGGGQAFAVTLAGTALLVAGVLAVRRRLTEVDPDAPGMLGLLVGAAIGNALSLFVYSRGVPDFIAVHRGGGVESVLNVADLGLLAGLALCCRTVWRVALAAHAERTTVVRPALAVEQRPVRRGWVEREVPIALARDERRSPPSRVPVADERRGPLPAAADDRPAERGER